MWVRARGKEQRGGVQLRRLVQAMANSSCRELGRGFVPAYVKFWAPQLSLVNMSKKPKNEPGRNGHWFRPSQSLMRSDQDLKTWPGPIYH